MPVPNVSPFFTASSEPEQSPETIQTSLPGSMPFSLSARMTPLAACWFDTHRKSNWPLYFGITWLPIS